MRAAYSTSTILAPTQPALVLIHGFGASVYHWRYNIPALVSEGYRVLALDLLGFGLSDKPIIDYSAETWRDQVQYNSKYYCSVRSCFVVTWCASGCLLACLLARARCWGNEVTFRVSRLFTVEVELWCTWYQLCGARFVGRSVAA